jgi:glyoxalase family protein
MSRGIHHVTAFASDPQANLDFYTGVLGLRFVKRTVNFDDPGTYHFYFGDAAGSPGTILTFFPWPGAARGREGTGLVEVTSFAVPEGALGFWIDRFAALDVPFDMPVARFDEEALAFRDPDGLELELVARADLPVVEPWPGGPAAPEHALRGFHGVTLSAGASEATAALVCSQLGYERVAELGERLRLRVAGESGSRPGRFVDLVVQPGLPRGRWGAGSVHHVAFRAADDADQQVMRDSLLEAGHEPTPVRDRQYFHSIYFVEPGGVLFEIATDPPGFALDEPAGSLGESLKLPPWLEPMRGRIEQRLPRIVLPGAGTRA